MSMHKIPLTELEELGLRAHGLDIGTPSQLSDAFRQGVAWTLQVQQPIAEVMSLFPLMGIAHIRVKMQEGVSPINVGDALYIDPVTSQAIKKE